MASNLTRVMRWHIAVERFIDEVLPMVSDAYEQDGEPDWVARSEAWNDWTDSLCKDGLISDWQYDNWTQPACCGR